MSSFNAIQLISRLMPAALALLAACTNYQAPVSEQGRAQAIVPLEILSSNAGQGSELEPVRNSEPDYTAPEPEPPAQIRIPGYRPGSGSVSFVDDTVDSALSRIAGNTPTGTPYSASSGIADSTSATGRTRSISSNGGQEPNRAEISTSTPAWSSPQSEPPIQFNSADNGLYGEATAEHSGASPSGQGIGSGWGSVTRAVTGVNSGAGSEQTTAGNGTSPAISESTPYNSFPDTADRTWGSNSNRVPYSDSPDTPGSTSYSTPYGSPGSNPTANLGNPSPALGARGIVRRAIGESGTAATGIPTQMGTNNPGQLAAGQTTLTDSNQVLGSASTPGQTVAGQSPLADSIQSAGSGRNPTEAPVERASAVTPGDAASDGGSVMGSLLSALNPVSHLVQAGDTLYSIAHRYNLDYRDLAAANGIGPPYTIFVGQELELGIRVADRLTDALTDAADFLISGNTAQPPSATDAADSLISGNTASPYSAGEPTASVPRTDSGYPVSVQWQWPHQGEILRGLQPGSGAGIDIGGSVGDPVLAAGEGDVVYAGRGVQGSGNLIIIRHNDSLLSAYAHNSATLVSEGQHVMARQPIAELGMDDQGVARLHFEIRQNGASVDPLQFLPQETQPTTELPL